eukprot:TRINITY_DN2120_c3_g1_i2.p1 TRINITY_DN2120_c3_g1~~TRINITY_DN2120_c3_g1_i2.p1  ORF type:complete len:1074 (-),score=273.92 TRINITY_DN2120_c3_g1_i2:386-3484(-)
MDAAAKCGGGGGGGGGGATAHERWFEAFTGEAGDDEGEDEVRRKKKKPRRAETASPLFGDCVAPAAEPPATPSAPRRSRSTKLFDDEDETPLEELLRRRPAPSQKATTPPPLGCSAVLAEPAPAEGSTSQETDSVQPPPGRTTPIKRSASMAVLSLPSRKDTKETKDGANEVTSPHKEPPATPERRASGFLLRSPYRASVKSCADLEDCTTDFCATLEYIECKEMKSSFETFLRGFDKAVRNSSMEDEATYLQRFLASAEHAMKTRIPWSRMSPQTFAIAKADMNRMVFKRLHNGLFNKKPLMEKDNAFVARVQKLRAVIKPEHLELGLKCLDKTLLKHAREELTPLDAVVTPFEKLTCIFNACKVLIWTLQSTGSSAGADDFLPLFIYLVIFTDLPRIHSNISFIQRFSDSDEKFGEAYCYFTHLVSAATYIETLSPESLAQQTKEQEQQAQQQSAPASSTSPSAGTSTSPTKQPENPPTKKRSAAVDHIQQSTLQIDERPSAEQELEQLLRSMHFVDFPASKITEDNTKQLLMEYNQLYQAARALVNKLTSPVSSTESIAFLTLRPEVVEIPTETKKEPKPLVVRCITWVHDYVWIAMGNNIHVYAARSCEFVHTFPLPCSRIYCIASHPDLPNVWCGADNCSIYVVTQDGAKSLQKLRVNGPSYRKVRILLPVSSTDALSVWSIATSETATSIVAVHTESQQRKAAGKSGKTSASANKVTTVCALQLVASCAVQLGCSVWVGTRTGQLLRFDTGRAPKQRCELQLPSRGCVASMGCSANLVWLCQQQDSCCRMMALDPASSTVVLAVRDPGVCDLLCMRAYGSRTLVTSHADGRILLWDSQSGTLVCEVQHGAGRGRERQRDTAAEGEPPTLAERQRLRCLARRKHASVSYMVLPQAALRARARSMSPVPAPSPLATSVEPEVVQLPEGGRAEDEQQQQQQQPQLQPQPQPLQAQAKAEPTAEQQGELPESPPASDTTLPPTDTPPAAAAPSLSTSTPYTPALAVFLTFPLKPRVQKLNHVMSRRVPRR